MLRTYLSSPYLFTTLPTIIYLLLILVQVICYTKQLTY